jgi:hypothetical protein
MTTETKRYGYHVTGKWGRADIEADHREWTQHVAKCVNSHYDLLAALETLLESVEGKKVTFGDCNQARAAIERATKGGTCIARKT